MIHLIDDWWRLVLRLWSIRLAIFWGAVCGLYVALPAFADMIPPIWFALACVGMSVAIVIARITKQPGLH
jgi:hypothetical protein